MNTTDIGNILEPEVIMAKNWGANLLGTRIDFGTGLTKPAINELPDLLNSAIQDMRLLRKHNMKCTIGITGDLFPDQTSKQNAAFWDHPQLEQTMCNIWQKIAMDLLDYRDVIYGYYLWGEPLDRAQLPYPPHQWRPIAESILKAIREVDDQTWIIFQPGPGGQPFGYKDMEPLPDDKVIYDIHYYAPHQFTHQGVSVSEATGITKAMEQINVPYPLPMEQHNNNWEIKYYLKSCYPIPIELMTSFNKALQLEMLRPAIEFQHKYNVPIIVLEFSVVRWAPIPDSANYLKEAIEIFEQLGWSWLYHAWGMEGNQWNLLLGEGTKNFWVRGMPWPTEPVPYETERAKVIKAGIAKNKTF
jgi:hypothetical protein